MSKSVEKCRILWWKVIAKFGVLCYYITRVIIVIKANIKKFPISDIKDKYVEIEKNVLDDNKIIFLTKKGCDSMVILSMDKYRELTKDFKYNEYVESALDEADKEAENPNTRYYTHKEVLDGIRRRLNE